MGYYLGLLLALSCVVPGAAAARAERDPPLPDFSRWEAGDARKTKFFAFLGPLLAAENHRVLEQRQRLEQVARRLGAPLSRRDRRTLHELAREYAVEPTAAGERALVAELLLRVDAVPVSLGLVQAAKESGWGTSRFAVEVNGLFGQRCFVAGCGLVPERRRPGEIHEVRAFPSPRAAVASYLRNLNTHPDYGELRHMRAQLRSLGLPLSGFTRARALGAYSERGDAYVREVRQMIRFNDLGPVEGSG